MTNAIGTAFFTSLVSYIVFLLAEYTRPGFVTTHFSVHWLLFFVVMFGVWWSVVYEGSSMSGVKKIVMLAARTVSSFLLFFLVWIEGEVFGDVRIFLALVAAVLPWMVSSKKDEDTYE